MMIENQFSSSVIMAQTAVTTEHDLAAVISVFVTMSHSVLGVHFLWDLAPSDCSGCNVTLPHMITYKRISWPSPCRLNRNFWWYLLYHATMRPVHCQHRYHYLKTFWQHRDDNITLLCGPGQWAGGRRGVIINSKVQSYIVRELQPDHLNWRKIDWRERHNLDSVTIMLWEYQRQ